MGHGESQTNYEVLIMAWISYDPSAEYPQSPQPWRGKLNILGEFTPAAGLSAFEVTSLPEGGSNRELKELYEVTAPDTLTPKDPATVAAIRADWKATENAINARTINAKKRMDSFLTLNAIKRIKTLSDAQSFIDSQVTDLASARDAMGKLLFVVVNLARLQRDNTDAIFPVDE